MGRELWDAYDRAGNKLGFDLVRGEVPRPGVYHMVAEVYALTRDGQILLTRRHPAKHWGGYWEVTGGSVLKGESPLVGAVRELREETGLVIPPEEFRPVYVDQKDRIDGYSAIYHSFLVFFDPEEQTIRLQEEETVDWRLMPYEEFLSLLSGGNIVPSIRERFILHRERLEELLCTNRGES